MLHLLPLPLFLFAVSLLLLLLLLLFSLRSKSDTSYKPQNPDESTPTHLTHSLLLEILPSSHLSSTSCDDENVVVDRVDSAVEEECDKNGNANNNNMTTKKKKKKKKKKGSNKKKLPELDIFGFGGVAGGPKQQEEELVCLYPFTSSSSATQRRIKQHYDQLVKSHHSNALTLAQVGQFVSCLIEARSELQQKSEAIQRKFTITKALLFKADRSSFDRLRQQIYKLEMEQKRLEEDAFVYNWLQQQLKLSPAYKKMLQIGACLESKAKSGELVKNTETELPDISFEELLAQEKKDSFWQKNGKPRSCLG